MAETGRLMGRDWNDLLPNMVARDQIAHDRRAAALRAKQAGLTFQQIGDHMGISGSRARQLVLKAERLIDKMSPVEDYLRRTVVDYEKLTKPRITTTVDQELTRLRAKLAEAEYLLRELDGHEGAEGWSEYLRQRLDKYEFETKGDDDAR